jgi:hypothetical protein
VKKNKLILFIFISIILACESNSDSELKTNNSTSELKLLNFEQIKYLVDRGHICDACPRTFNCGWTTGEQRECNNGKCALGSKWDEQRKKQQICRTCLNSNGSERWTDLCKDAVIIIEDIPQTLPDETIYDIIE